MERVVPVIIHHETGEKPQSGGKKNQEYLKYAVIQAKKYNEKVVLLGDKYNKQWCDDWHNADDFVTDKWKEFLEVFVNWSPYPKAWAEGIFKRFFLILEYLERYGYEDCVLIDSDVLIYFDASKYEPFLHCKTALEVPLNQDIDVLWKGNGYKWKACAGVAYFTKQGLIEFTDYCIDIYKNHREILLEKWDIHEKYKIYGGINEMTVLYLWCRQLPEGEFLNLLKEDENHAVVDNFIGIPTGYLDDQYEYDKVFNLKKMHWEDGRAYCYTAKEHEKHYFLGLHFGDVTKIFMQGVCEKNRFTWDAKLQKLAWKLRSKLADIKHGNTKLQQKIKLKQAEKGKNE